jgi:hypothetical protein
VGLILEALKVSKDYAKGKNDSPVFASRFDGVTTFTRHSVSQAVRRILNGQEVQRKACHVHATRSPAHRRHVGDGLHSRKQDDEVQLYALDILAIDGDDLRRLPPAPRRTGSR